MTTSYANNSGTGDRRNEIVTSTTFTTAVEDGGTDWTVLLDGITGTNGREPSNGTGDKTLTWDWGPGAEAGIVIDKLKFYNSTTTSYGANWTVEASDNGSSWTTLKSAFTLQGSTGGTEYTWTNTTGYRYYRIHTTNMANGGGGSGFWREFEFSILDITPQSSRPSWFNAGGKGNRGAFITVTSSMTPASGTVQHSVDGDYTYNSTHGFNMSGGAASGLNIRYDFGVGVSVVIDTVFWYQNGTATHGTWKVQGSNDASSWTDIGSSFTLGGINGTNTMQLGGNTTGYRYYQLLGVSGTTNATPTVSEVEFRIDGFAAVLAKDYKLSGYGIIAPIAAKDFKLSGYGIVAPITARAYKASGYAVIKPLAAASTGIVLITAIGE